MDVSKPFPAPSGFMKEAFYVGLSYADLQNPSFSDKLYIGTGEVLFKFSKFESHVKITVVVKNLNNIETFDDGDIDAAANTRDQYLLFKGFPADYVSKNSHCAFDIWIISLDASQTGKETSVEVTTYSST